MALAINPNPYVRNKRSTFGIMMELLIGLVLVWIASIVYYFIKGTGTDGLYAILNVIICVVACFGTELLFFIPSWKKEEGHNFVSLLKKGLKSYGYISGIILALILPLMTNANPLIHIVNLLITCVVSVGVFKMLFGGFGYNIFNVALVGRVFASLCFGSGFNYGTRAVGSTVEVVGSTLLTDFSSNGFNSVITFTGDNSLFNVLLGNYRGTLGETFTLLILVIGIVLAIRKVIDWKLPVFFLGTCFLTSVIVGSVSGADNVLTFAAAHLLTGGIAFGAVFCITDPVTAPTNNLAKVVYAVFAGFLTMLIRFKGSMVEGVAFAILCANMIAPFIANFYKGRTTSKLIKRGCITGAVCALMVLVSCAYGNVIVPLKYAGGADVTLVDQNTYNVKIANDKNKSGFGDLNMDVEVNPSERLIVSITINSEGTGATDGYGLFFFGEGECHVYGQAKVEKLTNLSKLLVTFENGGISFDTFRQYDFEYWDAREFRDFNDLSSDITACGATYTVASYIYGINAVIDVVEAN